MHTLKLIKKFYFANVTYYLDTRKLMRDENLTTYKRYINENLRIIENINDIEKTNTKIKAVISEANGIVTQAV